jgi:hypothetical protein
MAICVTAPATKYRHRSRAQAERNTRYTIPKRSCTSIPIFDEYMDIPEDTPWVLTTDETSLLLRVHFRMCAAALRKTPIGRMKFAQAKLVVKL